MLFLFLVTLHLLNGWLDRLHFACNLAYGCVSLNSSLTYLLYTIGFRVFAIGSLESSVMVVNFSIVLIFTKICEIPGITADFDGLATSQRHVVKWESIPAANRDVFADLYTDLHQPRVHEDLLHLVEILNRDPVTGVNMLNEDRYRYLSLCKNDYLTNKLGRAYLFEKVKLIRRDSVLGSWAFGDANSFPASMYHFGPAFNVIADSKVTHPHQILCSSGNSQHPLHRRGDMFVVKSLSGVDPAFWPFYKFHACYE